MESLVADMVTTEHAGELAMEEDGIFQKLKLIGLTPAEEDMVAEGAVSTMDIAFKEERIDS